MVAPIGLPEQFGTILRGELGRETGRIPIGTRPASGTSFADRVREFVSGVNQDNVQADAMARDFAEGRNNDIHGTMIALQKADISLRLFATVKNRVIDAYREVMRMGA